MIGTYIRVRTLYNTGINPSRQRPYGHLQNGIITNDFNKAVITLPSIDRAEMSESVITLAAKPFHMGAQQTPS